MINIGDWVIVCDHHQDIFYGKLAARDRVLRTADLEPCRRISEFHVDGCHVGDLARLGPKEGAENLIDGPVEYVEVDDVANVSKVSARAVKAFEAVKWTD